MPAQVPGLSSFVLGLASGSMAAGPPLRVSFANPIGGAVGFASSGFHSAPVDLFDLQGRRVASLTPSAAAGGTVWSWDGRDESGRAVGAGVLFARERGTRTVASRVMRVP